MDRITDEHIHAVGLVTTVGAELEQSMTNLYGTLLGGSRGWAVAGGQDFGTMGQRDPDHDEDRYRQS